MYAWDIAPGIGRRFAIDKLSLGSRETEGRIREEFFGKIDFSRLTRIAGSDSDEHSIAAARANLSRAIALAKRENPADLPLFEVLPMQDARPQVTGDTGFSITNPPYGRRLGDTESAEKIYSEMGKLISGFPGWKLVLITEHSGFESFFGRKADSCREMTNGAINTCLYQYEKL
jgi:putative N6-adenine-specific DNA methylase